MSYACQICGKVTVTGRTQRHRRGVAGKRWLRRAQETPRLFKPNLQWRSLVIKGEEKKMRICTSCLKRIKKFGSVRQYSNIAVA